MIFARILLGIESSVISLQLLQSLRSPFLGILMMIHVVQSSGIFFLIHISLKSACKISAERCGTSLKSSTHILLCPGALPFFRHLIVEIISSVLGASVCTGKSSSASSISVVMVGGGLF